jgi:predicted transcriptional regulator
MPTRRPRSEDKHPRPPLGGLELEVMFVVWKLGDCTSGDVIAAFAEKRALAASTIRNVLAKLRAKGYVTPIPSIGRGFLLRPTVERDAFAQRSLKSLLASLFEGSPKQAIAYLLDDTRISQADLDEIRKQIDARKRRGETR